MADFVFNQGLGRVTEKAADGADLRLLILKASDTDAAMKDVDTIAELLGLAAVTEADFDNYARATLSNVAVTVDDAGDAVEVDCDDVLFSSAGGTTDNTTTDAIIYEHITDDTDAIPLVCLDAVFTTDGSDKNVKFDANGFYGAS